MIQKISYLLFLFFGMAFGQQDLIQSIDFAGGYEPNGYFVRTAYNQLHKKNLLRVSGQYHRETFNIIDTTKEIDATLFLLGLEYYRQLWNYNGRDIVLYLGTGVTGGLESIADSQNSQAVEKIVAFEQITAKNTFVYGGHIGAEIEKYLVQLSTIGTSLSMTLNVRQYYLIKSLFDGATMFNASLGLKLNF